MRWVESHFDYLSSLADPTGNGLITSSFIDSDPNPKPLRHRRPQRVMIRGVLFNSYSAAAEAVGVTRDAVRKAALAGNPDRLMPRHWWEVGGIEFPTLRAASEYFLMPIKEVQECAEKFYPNDPLKKTY